MNRPYRFNTINPMKKWLVLLCFLFASFAMFWHAVVKSPTFDEPGHIQAGFYHWRHHDMERGLEHPPLMRLIAAFPLNFLHLTDPQDEHAMFLQRPLSMRREQLYGTLLVYNSPEASAEKIMILTRSMMIIITLFLFLLVWHWSRELYGENGGLFSLFLAVTFPALLGHGSLVNTDVGGAAAALFFVYVLSQYLETPSWPNLIYCGFNLGVAQASKLSNIILIPAAFFMMLVYPGASGISIKKRVLHFLVMLAAGTLFLDACYRFQSVIPPHGINPQDLQAYGWGPLKQFIYRWAPLPDFYLMSFGFLSYHLKSGFSTYLFGEILPKGVWYYFPSIFLLRTPAAALAAIVGSAYSFRKLKLSRREFPLVFMAAGYAAVTLFSSLNLGIRHLLFIYPFLFILCGRLAAVEFCGLPKLALAGLLLFQVFEIAWVSPDYIAFYNFLCGGPSQGIQYSSDLDYGQDLKPLGKFMKNYPGTELVLSYMGTAVPQAYGLEPQELLPQGGMVRSNKINSLRPSREFLAVSVSQIQGQMSGGSFAWLKSKTPMKIIGRTIFVYDITSDRQAHEKMAELYEGSGEKEKAQRERERAKILYLRMESRS